ncbi:MAG: septal ring lytic transglycosylase RlpA family protein [Pseudomonadota bacterium]
MPRWGAILLLAMALAACGSSASRHQPPPPGSAGVKVGKPYEIAGIWYYPKDDPAYDEVGEASWYGPGFHGRATASGERYDMNALTAAHRTLPMPSYVEVTNLDNGRKMVLKVNDRGPFAKGRIIDVSRRAAQLLGFHAKGVERVRVRRTDPWGNPLLVQKGAPRLVMRPGPEELAPDAPVFVQVGSFASYDNATRLQRRLSDIGAVSLEAAMVDGQTTYRVRLGPFAAGEEAENVLALVQRRGFPEARLITFRSS